LHGVQIQAVALAIPEPVRFRQMYGKDERDFLRLWAVRQCRTLFSTVYRKKCNTPNWIFIDSSGNLFGTTAAGPGNNSAFGGTIYEITQ
jgi:hypothetical protein